MIGIYDLIPEFITGHRRPGVVGVTVLSLDMLQMLPAMLDSR
jgi:membrane-bound ClpP family serine protease